MSVKFKTAKDLSEKIDQYFDETPKTEQTRAGLCVFLGISRVTWQNYGKDEKFAELVDLTNTRIEAKYEYQLNTKGRPADMFALKQYGWVDRQEVENKMSGGIQIISNIPRPTDV